MKKNVTKALAVVAAVAMVSMTSVSAFAETEADTSAPVNGTSSNNTTAHTTVKYEVTEGYTWTIHSAIDFTSDKGANSTTVENTGNKVNVTKNVIPDGKTLKITVRGSGDSGEYQIKNGSTVLSYTIKKETANKATGDALGIDASVLEVPAGTNTDEASLTYTLTTGTGSAEVAGKYTGTVTYTASVVNATTVTPSNVG